MRHEGFSQDDQAFVNSLMESGYWVGGGWYYGPPAYGVYSGWYPGLFYRTLYWPETDFHLFYGAAAKNTIVADVNTDVPDSYVGDEGSVLHQGIGRVNMLMIAVDLGPERFVCAGPVLSHYEFEVLGAPRRLDDIEWGGTTGAWGAGGILSGEIPWDLSPGSIEGVAPPVWTQSYLVPRGSE